MSKIPGIDEKRITLSRLNEGERAKLIAAASREADGVRRDFDEEKLSREIWLHIFQSVLASEGLAIEQQADVTRAAFNTSAVPANSSETKIITKLVKNLSASDEASLIEEVQKAITQAEDEKQYTLLRKLIAVLWELERIAAIKRQEKSA